MEQGQEDNLAECVSGVTSCLLLAEISISGTDPCQYDYQVSMKKDYRKV